MACEFAYNPERKTAKPMVLNVPKAHKRKRYRFIPKVIFRPKTIIAMLAIFFISACVPNTLSKPGDAWDYTDLLEISPYSQVSAELDFIAAYSRFANSDLQIRFDHLDLKLESTFDLYIALDTRPGGTNDLPIEQVADIEWDNLLVLPASGNPRALSPSFNSASNKANESEHELIVRNDLIPRISRNPWHDYSVISINPSKIPGIKHGFTLQAFTTKKDSVMIADEIGPVRFDSSPPGRAPVLLAFWNTFTAYTPAQTLRRWDGAHTGPFGERHGLSILLNNIDEFRIPVYLLDLRNPTSLSALEFSGGLPLVQELVSKRLVVLPDLLPGSPVYPIFPIGLPDWASSQFLEELEIISYNNRLPSSQILYSPAALDKDNLNYAVIFTTTDLNIEAQGDFRIYPIPQEVPSDPQATAEGLSIPIRKSLIDIALSIDHGFRNTPMLILGGSLSKSAFADPQASAASLSYIASHPWIDPQDESELISSVGKINPRLLPVETEQVSIEAFSPSEILSRIIDPSEHPENPLYLATWQAAISLYEPLPPESSNLPHLRSLYSGQPGILLAAANWAQDPRSHIDCHQDLDFDGLPECIIASNRIFSVVDIQGARLIAMFNRSETGIHQIIGTTSQFIVGLSDPSAWNLEAGEGADPDGIHGALTDNEPPWELYEVSIDEETLTLSSPDQRITKHFSITPNGLRVDYSNIDAVTLEIPFVIDPWKRFSPDWSSAFHGQTIPNGYRWSYQDEINVEIISNLPINTYIFNSSLEAFDLPEDPNFDYPQGHYLPFPLLVLEYHNAEDFYVEINPLP